MYKIKKQIILSIWQEYGEDDLKFRFISTVGGENRKR
jgi:hypothetical protein